MQVATWLRNRERLAQVGGNAYLATVMNAAPVVANIVAYADTVSAKARARRTIEIARTIMADAQLGRDVGPALVQLGTLRAPPKATDAILCGAQLAAPLGAVDYLVPEIGLVAGAGAPHMLAGFGFTAKTIAAQSAGLSLAAGRAAWGAFRTAPRRVIHVDLEQGDRLTRRRYQRLALAEGIDLAALGDRLALSVMPEGLTLTEGCADRWRALMSGRDLLLVDSLRAATGGQDENSSDIRAGLDMLGKLSEATGCRALVIHHARKPSADDSGDARFAIRGSGAIFDACDGVFVFSAERGEPVRVQNVKARTHGEPVDDFALVVSDVEVEGDERAGVRVQVHGAELLTERRDLREASRRDGRVRADADAVRRALGARPGLGTVELKGATSLPGDRLSAALMHLGAAIEVQEQPTGYGRPKRLHFLRGAPS